MSRTPTGHVCDGCGTDIGNGGIGSAMSLVDYHDGEQRHRHLCYEHTNEAGETVTGCRDLLLGELP